MRDSLGGIREGTPLADMVATIDWAEGQPPIVVSALAQLDRALDTITAQCPPDKPTIVFVEVHGHTLSLGLGASESFVQLTESDDPPYMLTVGDSAAEGQVPFLLQGEHDTEIPRRNLVPLSTARAIVREFFTTGRRPSITAWEEV